MALATNYAEYSAATFPTEAQVQTSITYTKGFGLPTLTGTLDPGAGGPYPDETDVRDGVAYATSSTGSLVVPAATDVRNGINYDVAPNAKTGSVVIPAATDVRESIAYDVAPQAKTGSVVIPVATDVRETIAYDVAPNAKTGSVVIPTIDKVVLGTNYDVAPQAKTGNVRLPADTDVRLTVAYGPADVDTGNVRVPPVDKVEDGYFYDANDSLEGTLDPGAGGPYPEIVDVRFGTAYGTTQVGSAYIPVASDVRFGTNVDATTGTAYIPVATDVRLGTNVDATIGTVVIPAEADVRLGTVYDVAPQAKTGALDVDAEDNHPQINQVLDGVTYGNTLQYVGTLDPGAGGVMPSPNDVRFGIDVAETTGLAHIPNAADVRLGVSVDVAPEVGTLNIDSEANLPSEPQVLYGVSYGETFQYIGSLITGTSQVTPRLIQLYQGDAYDGTGWPSLSWETNRSDLGDVTDWRFAIKDSCDQLLIDETTPGVSISYSGSIVSVSLTSDATSLLTIANDHKFSGTGSFDLDSSITFASGTCQVYQSVAYQIT